uniref:Uncharacterized protein n=1 Tax=Zonotrichia albicollis TaxID=44394 RepID=A0A8D2MPB8_ZONAL
MKQLSFCYFLNRNKVASPVKGKPLKHIPRCIFPMDASFFTGREKSIGRCHQISRSSDSTSFLASSLSELIKLKAMTSPRCWTSMLSCKQSLCKISSHWVVCKGKGDH